MASNGLNGLAINGTNGVHRSKRLLRKGIYAPIPTFFQPETEDLGKYLFIHLPSIPLTGTFYYTKTSTLSPNTSYV